MGLDFEDLKSVLFQYFCNSNRCEVEKMNGKNKPPLTAKNLGGNAGKIRVIDKKQAAFFQYFGCFGQIGGRIGNMF